MLTLYNMETRQWWFKIESYHGKRLLMYIIGKLNDEEISLNFRQIYPIYDSQYFIYDSLCIVSSVIYLVT